MSLLFYEYIDLIKSARFASWFYVGYLIAMILQLKSFKKIIKEKEKEKIWRGFRNSEKSWGTEEAVGSIPK